MIFVGIDVIGDWLTEINVTSPTGIQEIDRFDGISIEAMIWGPHRGKTLDCLDSTPSPACGRGRTREAWRKRVPRQRHTAILRPGVYDL